MQVNLQHSKAATTDILKIIEEDKTDIICVQEPYTFQNKAVGIPKTIQNLHLKRRKVQGSSCSDKQPDRHHAHLATIGR
jgi:hypothetical protein